MAYEISNGNVTVDVTWHPKVLWGSTVGYPSDSLASRNFIALCQLLCSLGGATKLSTFSVCIYLFIYLLYNRTRSTEHTDQFRILLL